MDIQQAVVELESGFKVRRTDWGHHKDAYLELGETDVGFIGIYITNSGFSVNNMKLYDFSYYDLVSDKFETVV